MFCKSVQLKRKWKDLWCRWWFQSWSRWLHETVLWCINISRNKSIQNHELWTKLKNYESLQPRWTILSRFIRHYLKTSKPNYCTTVSKKKNWDTNVNCRPVIILSNVSKILERVIFLQLSDYRETLFTCSQCKYAILLAILTLPTPYISEI